jgi:hypothetical protein
VYGSQQNTLLGECNGQMEDFAYFVVFFRQMGGATMVHLDPTNPTINRFMAHLMCVRCASFVATSRPRLERQS